MVLEDAGHWWRSFGEGITGHCVRGRDEEEATVQRFKYSWTHARPDIVWVNQTLSGRDSLSGRTERTKIFRNLKFENWIALRLRICIDIGHGLQTIFT
jgi:hypothetical protein